MFLRNFLSSRRFIHCTAVCKRNMYSTQAYTQQSALLQEDNLNLTNVKLQQFLQSLRKEFYNLRTNTTNDIKLHARANQLNGLVRSFEEYEVVRKNLATKEDIDNEKDEDMRKLIEEENEVYAKLLSKIESELISQLLLLGDDDTFETLIFEVKAGAGGQEAMLFAMELFKMYTNYFEFRNWDYEVMDQDTTDIGGLRHANIIIEDPTAYNYLRYEGGVHRVQRVPATEKSGRIHTSTASVAIIPCPANVNITIAEKDLKIETKRASGAGGQHVNTTDSAVRLVHLPTGIAIESQSERSQIKNREIAMKRLETKLLQQQLEHAETTKHTSRKAQQGSLNRNEKIRTYNFVQDRITDHRISGGTVHNLPEFLKGNASLDNFILRVVRENRKSKLLDAINQQEGEEDLTNKSNK